MSTRRMHRGILGGLILAMALVACDDDPVTFDPGVVGVFSLYRVDGKSLPFVLDSEEPQECDDIPGHVELAAGQLTLDDVGYSLILGFREVCTPEVGSSQLHNKPFMLLGIFSLIGEELMLYMGTETGMDPAYVATFSEEDIELKHDDLNLKFRREEDG